MAGALLVQGFDGTVYVVTDRVKYKVTPVPIKGARGAVRIDSFPSLVQAPNGDLFVVVPDQAAEASGTDFGIPLMLSAITPARISDACESR